MLKILARRLDNIGAAALKETEKKLTQTACPAAVKVATSAVMFLLTLFAGTASAQTAQDFHITFVNVADTTQGMSGFSQFPAINNRGAVAFVARPNGTGQEVFKWEHRELTRIASATGSPVSSFADDVAINDAGVVAFHANLSAIGRAAGIFTSDGITTRTIVNSTEQGLPGFGIGSPSINTSGTVAFQAARNFFRSAVIFTGDGGALTPVVDTLNSNFGSFGNVAINASGQIVFRGVLKERNEGVFLVAPNRDDQSDGLPVGPASLIDVVDTINNPDIFQFGDPVINDAGVVADLAGGATRVEVLSGNRSSVTARTDVSSGFFIDIEHPSINNRGAVAFSAFEANGAEGIFVELTGGASPVAVLQTGDLLFGSTVTAVSVGRFAFNDHLGLVFEYELADGRSGIAVAALHGDREAPGDEDDSSN